MRVYSFKDGKVGVDPQVEAGGRGTLERTRRPPGLGAAEATPPRRPNQLSLKTCF
jgi:hypothetical protein